MANFRPRKNQSERHDLSRENLKINIIDIHIFLTVCQRSEILNPRNCLADYSRQDFVKLIVISRILISNLHQNISPQLWKRKLTSLFRRQLTYSHSTLMAGSVQLFSQSDCSICVSVHVEFY